MSSVSALIADPAAWAALLTLIVLEVVLGVDNLIFVAIISNKLPKGHRTSTRTLGLVFALGLRLVLLSMIAWIVGLTKPVVDFGVRGPLEGGHHLFETAFSWRDLILIAGGVFLIWKAVREVLESVTSAGAGEAEGEARKSPAHLSYASAIVQIIVLDLVFSFDSILTAVGMTEHLPIMMTAVVIAVVLMMFAAGPLAKFVRRNPSIVMLALAFLIMIGVTLIADGFGLHIPKPYIYIAMVFSISVELLNMAARRKRARDGEPAEIDFDGEGDHAAG